MTHYARGLEKHMKALEVSTINDYRLALSPDSSDPLQAGASLLRDYADGVADEPSMQEATNSKSPKKVGTHLELLDCLTCDKCIPVCPNNANFGIDVPPGEHPTHRLTWSDGTVERTGGKGLVIKKRHQIGTVADVCNSCGQCDPWCPEDGGPYLVKPNVFLSRAAFDEHSERQGFWVAPDHQSIVWRQPSGVTISMHREAHSERFILAAGSVLIRNGEVVESDGEGLVDTHVFQTLRLYLDAFSSESRPSWIAPKS